MATYTTNLRLVKPSVQDNISLTPFNDNFDTIDTTIKSIQTSVNNINYIPITQRGAANGIATLDSSAKVTPELVSSRFHNIGTSATLSIEHAGRMLRVSPTSGTSTTTITIPTNDSVGFPVGTEIEAVQYTAGTVTFAAATGVTIYSFENARTIAGLYGCVCLKKLYDNVWLLSGALI